MRIVTDVQSKSFREFEGREYKPYKGMPIVTTIYETPLHPVIGEGATTYFARVRACPETVTIRAFDGVFQYGEERD